MITVVETPTFLKDVKRADLSEDKHRELVNFLATYPEAGVMMEGTGGVRKVRFAGQGRGKSGAYRIVYYFHSVEIPLFALALLAKNEKANLSKAERNELKALMPQIVEAYMARKK
ncbi:MAG: type II toxin-antitoxin system RelE/ParE family toxin [Proteobacteria bacterium]|nr:type II toxin-antitoxin system RelE/ParE family toxin [Pseudomonadota bacterium]MBU4571073.1 type II toxin-antitoxin system RelE/ParE family toxin [Pseudomonadota bacterium]MBU4593702.1 type II toxin-antitoxin system RelE/ParE family toxin [Pseudomonadota bacterium]